jgi:uracil-DNA glycosylase
VENTPDPLDLIRRRIIACARCPRLRSYCERVGQEKRAAFRQDTYWAKPVPGFGDPQARVAIIGLAPAAHGANRTGRNFTGDGRGGSGDFLMAAMHASGFANQPRSEHATDGLELRDAWIAAAVRCAPPDNKPTPAEIAECHQHLRAEIDALTDVRVLVALGRIAFDACWRLLAERGVTPTPRPPFVHGAAYRLPHAPTVIASYHPSRQNTNTGRLTSAMLRAVFRTARKEITTKDAKGTKIFSRGGAGRGFA